MEEVEQIRPVDSSPTASGVRQRRLSDGGRPKVRLSQTSMEELQADSKLALASDPQKRLSLGLAAVAGITDRQRRQTLDRVKIASRSGASSLPRRRCQIGSTKPPEGQETDRADGKVRYVPRPSVPTLSKAEKLLIQAEDVSVRGNPCLSRREAEDKFRALVRRRSVA